MLSESEPCLYGQEEGNVAVKQPTRRASLTVKRQLPGEEDSVEIGGSIGWERFQGKSCSLGFNR